MRCGVFPPTVIRMPSQPPDSLRQIELHGRAIPYTLRRSRRRTIGLAIDHRGLRVGAPNAARLVEIEALLRKHGHWVLNKLDSWQGQVPAGPLEVGDGLQLPWQGGTLTVRLAAASSRRSLAVWSADRQEVTLCLAPAANARLHLRKALQQRAGEVLAERLARLAAHYGVAQPPLALSSARTRWGSCSVKGAIRLNWRLLFMPLPVIDYVVAHELAHLKQMNHSPRFWSEVERLCPEWQRRRVELRQLGRDLPNL